MKEEFTSLGLMSGTSGDGVDASIIQSDGNTKYKVLKDKYFQYDDEIRQNIHFFREKIHNFSDLKKLNKELADLERNITLFHAEVVNKISENQKIDIVGFHGQTIYHNSIEKISNQLGEGRLLSQLTKKNIVYNFRQNDIENGGEGAPLTPIFHQLIATQNKFDLPLCFLNIGGISNVTIVNKPTGAYDFTSRDIGPGNCLIDTWVRKNSQLNYDEDGQLAAKGTKNNIILEQAQELFANRPNHNNLSFDINDFDVSFARGLSLEDGAATLTDFTAGIIGSALSSLFTNGSIKFMKVLVSGGGRKNKVLIEKIKKITLKKIKIQSIDNYNIDGDFVESQAFAFLAIRSFLSLPISFPNTTGCKTETSGGEIIKY
jgi:anhydro-N-acetylmuramic acid kinase